MNSPTYAYESPRQLKHRHMARNAAFVAVAIAGGVVGSALTAMGGSTSSAAPVTSGLVNAAPVSLLAVDTAKPIVGQLAKGQQISKGFLGVSTTPIDQGVQQQHGLDVDHGLLIADVTAGSAADQAGLRTGDVIVERHTDG